MPRVRDYGKGADPGDGMMKTPTSDSRFQTAAQRGESNLTAQAARVKMLVQRATANLSAPVDNGGGTPFGDGQNIGSAPGGSVPMVREVRTNTNTPAAPEEPMNSSQGSNRRDLGS